MCDEKLDSDLDTFARRLAGLGPVGVPDRDQILFMAGRKVEQQKARRLCAASVGLSLAVATAGVLLPRMNERSNIAPPEVAESDHEAKEQRHASAAESNELPKANATVIATREWPAQSYFRLRQIAITQGTDAFRHATETGSAGSADDRTHGQRQLLGEFLGS
ncbi:MAG: hypothetical protein KDA42_03365 [Planctomycetales bacterium]|nr:hypothetical protein [Planctomycetales bacterium]